MRAIHSLYYSQIYKKEGEKRYVFRLQPNRVKACKIHDDGTFDGRLFHVSMVATGKARSPVVRGDVDGTASAEVKDERSHCRPGI